MAVVVERRLNSDNVLHCLTELFVQHGSPDHIRSDNGSEFTAHAVRDWLGRIGVKTLYIEPGSPWENGYNESFNSKLRDEILNTEIFYTLNGEYLRQGLRALAQRHPMIGDVRGVGTIAGVELVRDRATQEPAKQETKRVINAIKEKGVLVGREGYLGNVLKIRPPMVFKPDNADFLIAAVDESLAAI